jgi:hypothetical protein
VLRALGRDRLGPVLLARQRATGRLVALTVLRPEWACLPVFVARLARDAFAAAQVTHPNLVRLLEFGEARGQVYIASEFVDGRTLAEHVGGQGQGPLPPRDAVVSILHAVRALMFAHGQGLFHGAITAESIIVDREGVTRVAGLGLAKTPESVAADEIRARTGPIPLGDRWAEEARAAARTDLVGLGRTLHHLLTGSLPAGDDSPTIVRRLMARGVPPNLAEVVGSLIDARSASGYAHLTQAAAGLERFLNAQQPGSGSTAPSDDHTQTLMRCLAAFRAAPAAALRRQVIGWAAGAWALIVLVSLLARQPRVAAGFLGLGVMTVLAYFVVNGLARRTELFTKVRALVLESRGDWLVGAAVLILAATVLVVFHLHWAYLGFAILGVIAALALHFEFDRRVEAEQRGAVDEARALLKALRLQGVGEETLRRFVRNAAGDEWEAFFEALFGFEAAQAAREPSDRGLSRLIRQRSVPWRDWVNSWVEARLDARRQAREQLRLQAIEERGLVAEGVNLLTARRKSRRIAEAMVAVAAELRAATQASDTTVAAGAPPSMARAIHQAVETPEHVLVEREHGLIRPETFWVWELLFGPRARFLLGSALLVGFLLWVDQNGIVTGAQIKQAAARAVEHSDPLEVLRDTKIDVRIPAQTKPLHLPFLPRPVSNLFQGWGAGAAGLILIVSALIPGPRMALFALPGAAIALFGPQVGVPALGPLDPATASMAIGAGVASLGIVFGRSR